MRRLTLPRALGVLPSRGTEAPQPSRAFHLGDMNNRATFLERKSAAFRGRPRGIEPRKSWNSTLELSSAPTPPPHPPFLTLGLASGRPSTRVRPPETMALKGAERRQGLGTGFRLRIPRDWATCAAGGAGEARLREREALTRLCCPPVAARGNASCGAKSF